MKQLSVILFLLCNLLLSAQDSIDEQLESINTEQDAITFLKTKDKSSKGEIYTFNEAKHKSGLAKELLEKSNGGTKNVDRGFEVVHYKVLDVYMETHYRAAIIMFDSERASLKDINVARMMVLKKYEEGYPFDVLAKQYSMDNTANQGGDLGWFTTGTYIEDLEHKIVSREYELNDIFLVDIPDENKYYVVLKTHEPLDIKQVKVLKVVEPRN